MATTVSRARAITIIVRERWARSPRSCRVIRAEFFRNEEAMGGETIYWPHRNMRFGSKVVAASLGGKRHCTCLSSVRYIFATSFATKAAIKRQGSRYKSLIQLE